MKDTFDKVVMDSGRKAQMRDTLLQQKKPVNRKWLAPVIGLAAAAVLIMVIPFTRTVVVSAAEKLILSFRTHSGSEVTIRDEAGETAAEVTYSDDITEYARVKDGRCWFVINDTWTDVTDLCSDTDYCRYEIVNDDGSREVIFAGGTPERFGWWSLYFDADGKYIWNEGAIPEAADNSNPEWYKKACFSEGIRCGDPAYDDLLEQPE